MMAISTLMFFAMIMMIAMKGRRLREERDFQRGQTSIFKQSTTMVDIDFDDEKNLGLRKSKTFNMIEQR